MSATVLDSMFFNREISAFSMPSKVHSFYLKALNILLKIVEFPEKGLIKQEKTRNCHPRYRTSNRNATARLYRLASTLSHTGIWLSSLQGLGS